MQRAVGAHDGLTAKLVERAGFDMIWASGFEISASYAVPDASILSMSQLLERSIEIRNTVSIPVISDCDTGFGNVMNVIYMVKEYEKAGINGVCIEDKMFPKVNSYIEGRQPLVSIKEFVGKIEAMVDTRKSKDFMLIARVEALIAKHGMDEALKRGKAYADAGADKILIHSKSTSYDEIYEFAYKWDKYAPLVIVPTSYPQVSVSDVEKLGVDIVIFANVCVRSSVKAMKEVLDRLYESDSLATVDKDLSAMGEVFELQGMKEFKKTEEAYLR